MNYQAFTGDSLTMMYEAVRGALAADDALRGQGEDPRFRVRETPDWKTHAADLESEMLNRGMFFEVIDWSENPGKPSFGAMTVGQWWHSARMHSATRRYGNLRSAEMPIVWNATILTGANMIPYDRATGAVSPTAGVSL